MKIKNATQYFLIVLFLLLITFLALPLISGTIQVSFSEQGFFKTGNSIIDASDLFILTLISLAFGGLSLWFAGERVMGARTEATMRLIGKCFLFSSLCFAVMALISPLMPELGDSIDWWETGIRYTTGILFLAGIVSFALSLCAGISFIWEA